VAGIPTYVLPAELALGKVLVGELPRPSYPPRLRAAAPVMWSRLAAGALHTAAVHARRDDAVACLANLGQAVLAAAQGRLASAGTWVLNEKGIVDRAGLADVETVFAGPTGTLETVVAAVGDALALSDEVWPPR
jgi:hypothetical protein